MRLFLLALLLIPSIASAHTLNMSYLDVQQLPDHIRMTAVFHPHQALVVAGLTHDEADPHEGGFADLIPELQEHSDLLAAYAVEHITITANDESCTWSPEQVDVPDDELDALADGITIVGDIACNTEPISGLAMSTSLFFDAFPKSLVVVRLEYPDGFADKLTLTSDTREGELLLDAKPPAAPEAEAAPPEDASRLATIIGWIVFVMILAGVGTTIYRTNIASPKE